MYWREHPPVHISLAALLRGLGGKPGKAAPPMPSPGELAGQQQPEGAGAMEAIAAILGPPTAKFRPPCRMLPAPDPQPSGAP